MPIISEDYWANFVAIILAFCVLALIIERGLYQIFDSKLWKKFEEVEYKQVGGDYLDLKPWIAAMVSIVIVYKFKLDMIAMIFKLDEPQTISLFITGLFVAGGSTGIYKFFKRARELKEAMKDQPNAGGKPETPSGSCG